MRRFLNVGYVQLLLHASERKMAIRPSSKGAMHSVHWRSGSTGNVYAKTLSCPHFGAALYEIMDWNPDYIYKVRGNWLSNGDEQIIIFNLQNAIGAVLIAGTQQDGSRKQRVEFFPEEWVGDFGDEFYDHIVENDIYYLSKGREWKSQKPSIPAPGIDQFPIPSENDVRILAGELIKGAPVSDA